MDLILAGQQHKEIADSIGRSVRTAKFHAGNLYVKHGVTSREELIRLKQSGGSKLEWDKLLDQEKRAAVLSVLNTRAEIGRQMGVSESKVGTLLTHVYRILGVRHEKGLAAYLGRHGLLSAGADPVELRLVKRMA